MPRPALVLSDAYATRLRTFEQSRKKMETLFSNGDISNRDMNLFYEGMYLKAVTSFEGFIEDLFLGLLTNSITLGRNIHPRMTFRSPMVAREVVFGGRPYVDWLPYDRTIERAAIFFRSGRPFSNLAATEKQSLEHMIIIRNAVAHQSNAAKNKFENKVLGTTPLLSRERTPAGFLRSVFRASPKQTRYEDIITNSILIAHKLCN